MDPRKLPPLSLISSFVDNRYLRYDGSRSAARDLSAYKIRGSASHRLPTGCLSENNVLSPLQQGDTQSFDEHPCVSERTLHRPHPSIRQSETSSTAEITTDFQRQLHQLPPNSWVDPNDWLFQVLHDKVKHLSAEELYQGFFVRAAREPWGINHSTANKKKSAKESPSPGSDDWSVPDKQGSKHNHSLAEQNRRKRHNELCRHGDNSTGTHVCDITNEVLPQVKAYIEGIEPCQIRKSSCQATKQSGKDEQLLSAVFNHHYAAITIMAMHDENLKARREARCLRAQLLDSQTQTSLGTDIILPPTPSLKRKAEDRLEDTSPRPSHALREQGVGENKSFNLAAIPRREDLPPSPTPSCEGLGSCFATVKRSAGWIRYT